MSRCQRGLTDAIVTLLRARGELSSREIFDALDEAGWNNGHNFHIRISALLANRRLRGLMLSRHDRIDGRRVYWRLHGMPATRATASKQYDESAVAEAIAAASVAFLSPAAPDRIANPLRAVRPVSRAIHARRCARGRT